MKNDIIFSIKLYLETSYKENNIFPNGRQLVYLYSCHRLKPYVNLQSSVLVKISQTISYCLLFKISQYAYRNFFCKKLLISYTRF